MSIYNSGLFEKRISEYMTLRAVNHVKATAAEARWIRAVRSVTTLLFALAVAGGSVSAAGADEGMWTLDNFPSAEVAQKYGITPSAAFLDHVRKATLRIAGGCSASFISPQGLVMTNHHCVVECVGQLATPQQDLVRSGFYAKRQEDERACPNFELDQLTQIEDMTSKIQGATNGKTGDAAQRALHAAEAAAEQRAARMQGRAATSSRSIRAASTTSIITSGIPTYGWPLRRNTTSHSSAAIPITLTFPATTSISASCARTRMGNRLRLRTI